MQHKYQKFATDFGTYNGLNTHPTDDLAKALIPPDLPFKRVRPIKTTGDGDCLFNAASIYTKGDESIAVNLRLLVACELYLNAGYYSNHPKLEEAKMEPNIISTDMNTLFSVLLTDHCTSSDDLEMCVKMEAASMCQTKNWSSMLQVLSLPNVLQVPVYSVYPDSSHGIRPLLNGMLQPRNVSPCDKEDPFIVMWSRDGNLDNRPGSIFQPNHFCLFAKTEDKTQRKSSIKRTESMPINDTIKKKKTTSTTASKTKQENILSFFGKPTKAKKATESTEKVIHAESDDSNSSQHMTTKRKVQIQSFQNEEGDSSNNAELDNTVFAKADETSEDIAPEGEDSAKDLPFEQRNFEKNISQCNGLCCKSDESYKPASDKLLKDSSRVYNNRTRFCQLNWFEDFAWLSYCTTTNRVYCSVCRYGHRNRLIKFSTKSERAFTIEGFNNWKKSPNRLREHQNSAVHHEITEKLEFLKKNTHVQHAIQRQIREDQAIHRKCLLNQLQSLKFLLRQGLAIRGKTQDEGNFSQLQTLRAEENPQLAEWIEKKYYQSPEIVNEQIQLLGHNLLRKLMTRINKAKYYSILADETRDIANREQLSISIRWVDDNLTVYEDFVGLIQLDATDSKTIYLSIKDVLLRLCLPLNCCRGQGYDGASNFMGKINGVAVQIRREVPQALVVHCFAHCLNLSLQDSCRTLSPIRDALDLVKEIASLIKWSPKRQVLFEKLQRIGGGSTSKIKPLCPTRWTVRTEAISSVLENYSEIVETMETVNATGNDDYSRRAGGVATLMQKFSTYFGLCVSHLLFSATEQLSTTLQAKNTCIQDITIGHKMVTNFCERQRTENAFEIFYSGVEKKSASCTYAPCLPRYRKVPKRLDDGEENFIFKEPKAYFRQQYFEAVDTIQNQLDRRFASNEIGIAKTIERILLESANGHTVEVPDQIKTLYKDDFDMAKLETQLKLMPDMIKMNQMGVKNVTNIRTICDIIIHQPGQSTFMSEVTKVLKLYLTIPVTTATSERSFSTLRRLKTYLRSTMTQERLNNTMLLHCYKQETDQIDLSAVAEDFISKSVERINFFGKMKDEN